MDESTGYRGLCSNCKHAPDCTYPRDPDHQVLQCEEYECAPATVAAASQVRPTVRLQANPGPDCSSEVKGLCANCANFDSCTFPKPEGGVWHCEEYC